MKALIDADMLRYEVGFICQYTSEDGSIIPLDFDYCIDVLEEKVREIEETVWADEPCRLYLTGDSYLQRKIKGCENAPLNFREKVAVTSPYKGNRSGTKPFHYHNLTVYMLANYDCSVAWGCEADDRLAIDHTLDPDNTIICSRDKDLRMVPGQHFRWQCGKQLGSGPDTITELQGLYNFYHQMLTGDTVDNIKGLPKVGQVKATFILEGCKSEKCMHYKVSRAYEDKIGEGYKDYFKEQAALLWMVREVDENGDLVHFKPWDER